MARNSSLSWPNTAIIDQRPDLEEKIIANRIAEHRHNMQATLQGLKAAAEQGP
jgi:hypothetical protein